LRAATAIGACRKVGTQTLTASRPSTFRRSFQSATACSIEYLAASLARGPSSRPARAMISVSGWEW
jgi:hypothetical protein